MFDYNIPTHTPSFRGAFEIEAQARKQEKLIAIMVAEYEADAAHVSKKQAENPILGLLASFFGGLKASNVSRQLANATNK